MLRRVRAWRPIKYSDKCTLAMNELWEQNRNALVAISLEKDIERFQGIIKYMPDLVTDLKRAIVEYEKMMFEIMADSTYVEGMP